MGLTTIDWVIMAATFAFVLGICAAIKRLTLRTELPKGNQRSPGSCVPTGSRKLYFAPQERSRSKGCPLCRQTCPYRIKTRRAKLPGSRAVRRRPRLR